MTKSIHRVGRCYGTINASQDELRHMSRKCPKCGQAVSAPDVFDMIPLIDCVSLIKISKGSKFSFSWGL